MTASYLDTTVIVNACEGGGPFQAQSVKFIQGNQPCTAAYYALRELLAGRVNYYCDTYNTLLAVNTVAEATLALARRNPVQGRKLVGRIEILQSSVQSLFPTGVMDKTAKRQVLGDVARRATELWRGIKRLNVRQVQPLGCFNDGNLQFGKGKLLRGPNDSFSCLKNQRCGAVQYIFQDRVILDKLVEGLHPRSLSDEENAKRENSQRRAALKHLRDKGPVAFDKRKCRSIGDAYFAAMCPKDSVVATTNAADFAPLCRALKTSYKTP